MRINSVLISVVSLTIVFLSTEVIAYRSMPIYKSVYKRPVGLHFYEPKYLVFSDANSSCFTDYSVTKNYNHEMKSLNRQVKPFTKQRVILSQKSSEKFMPLETQEVTLNKNYATANSFKSLLKRKKNHEERNIQRYDSKTVEKSSEEVSVTNQILTSEEFQAIPDVTMTNDLVPTVTDSPTILDTKSDVLHSTNDKTISITSSEGTELSTNGEILATTVSLTNYDLPSSDPVLMKYGKNITFADIKESVDKFERKFYNVTFLKLLATSPEERRENGISFAVSGIFLYMILISLASEVDQETRSEIENVTGFPLAKSDGSSFINEIVNTFPLPYEALKFHWTCRLIHMSLDISKSFNSGPASALSLHLNRLHSRDPPEIIAKILNKMVEIDSRGALHNTFEEQDVSDNVKAIILTTVYLRARWRAAPTLLNGTRPFYDVDNKETSATHRTTRMIRINDIMGYANLTELGAEVLEISYATPGLSLVMVVPYGRSLRAVAAHASRISFDHLLLQLTTKRIAATVPLFTLRMTLLLPKKLQAMGMSRLVNTKDYKDTNKLRISHAVQRLMFWSEAGRNAFKDDGIEWDQPPEQELVVDRPYIFYVRWHNITIMSGNFAL